MSKSLNKFNITGKNPDRVAAEKIEIEKLGFEYSKEPDFVVCLGGDGSFLYGERHFPQVPKLLARDSLICKRCGDLPLSQMLEHIKKNEICIITHNKLKAVYGGDILHGTNEIVVRNVMPIQALRFSVTVDGNVVFKDAIADGVVVSTPFGSTGYFESITRTHFQSGYGITLNNSTEPKDPVLLDSFREIVVSVTREKAHVAADNDPNIGVIHSGESVVITPAFETSSMIVMGSCPTK